MLTISIIVNHHHLKNTKKQAGDNSFPRSPRRPLTCSQDTMLRASSGRRAADAQLPRRRPNHATISACLNVKYRGYMAPGVLPPSTVRVS